MTKLEELCRAVCIADNVDPDAEGYGLGAAMPKNMRYPLWQAREKQVRAVLEALKKNPDERMLDAAAQVYRQASWTQGMLFEAVIDAVLMEKPNG